MRTAFVTGAAGFIGRHISVELCNRGWRVIGVDLQARHSWLDRRTAGTYLHYQSNLVGYLNDGPRRQEERYDLVVHAAAHAPHRLGIDTGRVFATNVELDATIYRWAARTGQPRLLYLSSCAAYPRHLQGGHRTRDWPFRESDIDLANPRWPGDTYGWAKLTGELMAQEARAGGTQVTVARPFSGYSHTQAPEFPFAAFLRRAHLRADPFEVWGDGSQTRDWVHVDDIVGGALAAVDAGVNGPVNICTGVGTNMTVLASRICDAAGYRPEFKLARDQPGGAPYRVGLPDVLAPFYVPRVTLEEGIARAFR